MSTINIKPSKRGSFTAWAKNHGMSVAEATSTVLAHKDRYSAAIEKKAQFSRNFGGHAYGGYLTNRFQDLTDDVHPYGVHGFGGTLTALNHPTGTIDGKPVESYIRKTPPQYKHGGKINGAVGWGGYLDNNKYDTGILEKHAYGGFVGNKNAGLYDNSFQKRFGGFYPKARAVGNVPIPMGMMGIDLNHFKRTYGQDMTTPTNDFGLPMNTGLNVNQGPVNNQPDPNKISKVFSDTGMQTTGKVAGVIGSIIGMADQIAAPIRKNADKTTAGGALVDEKKSARMAQLGYGFDPLRSGLETMRDEHATKGEKWLAGINIAAPGVGLFGNLGKKRAHRINEQGQLDTQKAISEQANSQYTDYLNSQFESGGQMDLYPAKDVIEYKGNEHQQGGIKVDGNGNATAKTGLPAIAEVEDGEMNWGGYVFSNKLSYGKR